MLIAMMISILFFVVSISFSQEYDYFRHFSENNKNWDIECHYINPEDNIINYRLGKPQRGNQAISQSFVLKSPQKDVRWTLVLKKKTYQVYIDTKLALENKNTTKSFWLSNAYNLNSKLDFSKINCELNIAEELPIVIGNSGEREHIVVHPHLEYDPFNLITNQIQNRIDLYKRNLILLESNLYPASSISLFDFISNTYEVNQPQLYDVSLDYRDNMDISLGPVGHRKFKFVGNKPFNIDVTGGNHNYCIWNTTRYLLRSYIRSENTNPLTINYLTDEIVVQRNGIINGIGFGYISRIRNNRLKDILAKKGDRFSKAYVKTYTNSFIQEIREKFKGLYSKINFKVNSSYFIYDDVIVGSSSIQRELEITINYL